MEAAQAPDGADTAAWDGTFDVVVVGFGIAGAVAARYATDASANVLLCDAAPEGEEGGTRDSAGRSSSTVPTATSLRAISTR